MSLKIKIFSDGADRKSMLEMAEDVRIQGMTTNPSLMKKAGITDYPGFAKDLLKSIQTKPISFEVFSDDLEGMEKQARLIAAWGHNVYVKIPVINTQGKSTAPLIEKLSKEGVKLNITAIFTLDQVVETVRALKGGAPSLVSVFAGRIADAGRDPIPLMKSALEVCHNGGRQIELLWASTREVWNIFQADQIGVPVITVPFDLIKKLDGVGKDSYQMSLETVQAFKKDSEAAGFRLE